jgi:hypothetical protein
MKSPPRSRLTPLLAGLLLLAAGCNTEGKHDVNGAGGSGAGKGGSTGAGTGGATTGGGGRIGTGGRDGGVAPGTDAAGQGGRGTGGAAADAGAGDAGAVGAGDDFVTGVTVTVHPQTTTILVVTWTQARAADTVRLEFSFAGSAVLGSRPLAGAVGAHRDVVLGVPATTAVTVRIVSKVGATDFKTRDYTGTTGAIPAGMPRPTLVSYNAALATTDRYLFGAVENSEGACNSTACYYDALFWLYIMDRQGRILWYYADAAGNPTSSFQRIAKDGEYIWIEKRPFSNGGTRTVLKMTLDRQYSQSVTVPGLSDCIDVTTDGALLYDANNELREMNRAGTVRTIFSCRTYFGANFQCYTNTVNWNAADDTVVMSYPDQNTVIQVSRQTGTVVGLYGDAPGSYTFSPTTWQFEFEHFPNITPQGTLILSSHMPGFADTEMPVAGQHAFMEFTIDRANRRLVEKWIYNVGQEWAMYKGMAIRLANGNTLANYGTGGVIREITPDKRTAFEVKFDVPTGNDFFNKMVGNNVLIDDLYALNGGGPR